jgi:hypothetical protein
MIFAILKSLQTQHFFVLKTVQGQIFYRMRGSKVHGISDHDSRFAKEKKQE